MSSCSKDHFLEVLFRTLEGVFHMARRTSQSVPSHLIVVTDNTVAQAKNQYVVMLLAWLVSRKLFTTTVLFHLMVGHTHEDREHF